MSYCVNCGVELRESEKKCPLCNTVVINPSQLYDEKSEPAYPKRTEALISSESRKATFWLVTAILLGPAVICLVVDYAIQGGISWSFYASGGIGTLWVIMVVPFAMKNHTVVKSLVLDIAAVLIFLYYVEKFSIVDGVRPWFLALSVPVVLVTAAGVLCAYFLVQYTRLCKLTLAAAFIVLCSALLAGVEVVTDIYLTSTVKLEWSLVAMAAAVCLAVVLLVINRKRNLKNSLKKRIHI